MGDWGWWYLAVMDRLFDLNNAGKVKTTEQWYSAFKEIGAGVEAKK